MKEAKYAIYAGIGVGIAVALVLAFMAGTGVQQPAPPIQTQPPGSTPPITFEFSEKLKKFSSTEELKLFLLKAQQSHPSYLPYGTVGDIMLERAPAAPTAELSGQVPEAQYSSAGPDYSTTNVQVLGVDEPDFLKNDGKYTYILSNDKLTIIEAYPPENASVIAKVGIDVKGQNLQNMFLNKDRLVIFYQDYGEDYYIPDYDYRPSPIYSPKTHALILDISERDNPKKVKDYVINGNYHSARMIGDLVYFIAANPVDYIRPLAPRVMESSETVLVPDIFYFDIPHQSFTFNTIAALDIFGDEINAETFMIDSGGTMYVSEKNIYITYPKYLYYPYGEMRDKDKFFDVIVPLLPKDVQEKVMQIEKSEMSPEEKWRETSELLQETYNKMSEEERDELFSKIQNASQEYESRIVQERQKTVIHKIGMDRLILTYSTKAEVPGHLLNQFSMDEFGNRFRVATTLEFYTSHGSGMYNNVYVLDQSMKIVGSLEKIAPDERIYSARFMDDKLYLVTFRQVDPFFVIDLSKDTPEVLGALKIPGFSNYLHPYDAKHIIGIGRDTKVNQWGGVQTLGVKVALFDVTDVSNPREVDSFTIGDQSTDSEALFDHKAVLFDKNKNVLSIPIRSYSDIYLEKPMGDVVVPKFWQGFYVFGVEPAKGINLKGQVQHSSNTNYDYGYGSRSFYIGDVLYTVTGNLMKMNNIEDMREIKELKLGSTGQIIKYID